MIHSEVRWEVLGRFRRSDVAGPQEDRVIFLDEGDEFIWETIALSQLYVLVDDPGVRLCGWGELSNVDVFRTVPRMFGLFLVRIEFEKYQTDPMAWLTCISRCTSVVLPLMEELSIQPANLFLRLVDNSIPIPATSTLPSSSF